MTKTYVNLCQLQAQERMMILEMVRDKSITVPEAEKLLGAVQGTVSADDPHSLIQIRADFSLDKGKTFQNAIYVEATVKTASSPEGKPFTVVELGPREAASVFLKIVVPSPDKQQLWNSRSTVARLAPILLKVTVEEAMGHFASIKGYYMDSPMDPLPGKDPNDYFAVIVDDAADYSRSICHITKPPPVKANEYVGYTTQQSLFSIRTTGGSGTSMDWSIDIPTYKSWVADARKKAIQAAGSKDTVLGLYESPIDWSCYNGTCTGLFDLSPEAGLGVCYGLKIKMTGSNDNWAEASFLLPSEIYDHLGL